MGICLVAFLVERIEIDIVFNTFWAQCVRLYRDVVLLNKDEFPKASGMLRYYRCSSLPGSMRMPFSRPKTPSIAMPNNLNGSVSNQKTGYSTKAKIASGQQSITKTIQVKNVSIW